MSDEFSKWWVGEKGRPPERGESELFDLCRSVWEVRVEVEKLDEPRGLSLVRRSWEAAGPRYDLVFPEAPDEKQEVSAVAQFQRDYQAATPPRPKAYDNTHIHTAAAIKMRIGADQPLSFVAQTYGYPEEAVCVVLAAFEVGGYTMLHHSEQWDERDLADAEQNARDEYPSVAEFPGTEAMDKIRSAERAAYLVGRQHERRHQVAKGKSA